MKQTFDFKELTTLCFSTHEKMQQRAAYTVNISLVIRNWLFGCYIAEFEQKGENRAGYGSTGDDERPTRSGTLAGRKLRPDCPLRSAGDLQGLCAGAGL